MSRRVGLTSVAFDDFDDDDFDDDEEEEDEERRSTSEEEEKKEEKRKESNPLVLERENEEEEEDVRCFDDAAKTLTTTLTTSLTAARKVLKYDEDEDDDEHGRGRSGRRNDEEEEEEEEEKIMERHERNVRDVLRKTIATEEEEDFEEEEEEKRDVEMTTRHHVSTEKNGNEDDEEEEDDVGAMVRTMMMANAGNEDALTTTRTTTTTTGPASPPKRFQSAFDVARRALKEENYRSTRNGIPPMITKDKSKEQSVPTLVVDAHAFGGKAFRGSWAGTSGRFAFCDGSKIVERTVATIKDDTEDGAVDEEEVKRRMLFQARAIKNGLKCFDAFSDKENHPRCRLHVPPEDVREFCRVHCEALANALMVFSNSNSSNSHSNDDSSKTSRRRTASKTKRAIELWDLLELLYKKDELGAQRGSAADTFRRKQNLSKWLKRSLKRAEKEKATEMDAQPMDFDDNDEYNNNNKSFSPRKENNNDPVSVALSRNDVVLATQLAMNDGDIRLATIIAQSGASDNIKNLANAQLNAWENAFGTATHKFIPSATRSVMELLAGRVETMSSEDGTSRNSTPESKDWIENLSKRVWFHHNVAETTERILERYERDILEDGAALFPHPCGMSEDALVEHKCEGIVKDARYDALLLTSSAAGANISNAHPFHQLGFGEDFLEFSNSWMATQFVLSQQSSSAMSQESELSRRGDQYTENLIGQISQLNAYFANDEENTEENRVPPKIECEWLLFVALFIRNDSKRERACKRILTETVREWRKSAVKLDVLARKFQLPKNWFDEANEAKRNVEKPALTNSLYR